MRLVKSRNTGAEVAVRKLIWSLGYRYSLRHNDLPGRPDIILPRHKAVVFVHGCFWHRHASKRCKLARLPKSNLEFWLPKLTENRRRDRRTMRKLKAMGWKILVVWECEIDKKEQLKNVICAFLGDGRASN